MYRCYAPVVSDERAAAKSAREAKVLAAAEARADAATDRVMAARAKAAKDETAKADAEAAIKEAKKVIRESKKAMGRAVTHSRVSDTQIGYVGAYPLLWLSTRLPYSVLGLSLPGVTRLIGVLTAK